MASGWANDDAVNEQINSTIEDAIASRRKIYKNQLIQDIIAEVRKTASYVNYNWRDV